MFVETENGLQCCKLIAVHAGLEKERDVKELLKILKDRDTRVPKVEALSGRKNVWNIPEVITCCFFLCYFSNALVNHCIFNYHNNAIFCLIG